MGPNAGTPFASSPKATIFVRSLLEMMTAPSARLSKYNSYDSFNMS